MTNPNSDEATEAPSATHGVDSSANATASPSLEDLQAHYAVAAADHKRARSAAFGGSLMLALILLLISFMPVPYVRLSPGPMFNTVGSYQGIELIKITGTKVYPTTGELNLTTVNERGGPYGELTLPEALVGWISDKDVVVPTTDLFPPGTTEQDAIEENQADFSDSQSSAIAAALSYLKIPLTTRVKVAQVGPNAPANGLLKPGDIITAVDGTPVNKPEQMPPLVRSKKPGTVVTFSLLVNKIPQDVAVPVGPNPRNPAQGYVGVLGSTEYSGPFPITFGLQDVGGPSAGTMFALGIVDKLTPENLSDDKIVAGTGTIDPKGEVGKIGGIQQKMYAARDNGAQLFLAPRSNCDVVRSSAPEGLNIAAVNTLSEAVDVLRKWRSGSGDLPRC